MLRGLRVWEVIFMGFEIMFRVPDYVVPHPGTLSIHISGAEGLSDKN